jgi:L-fuconolactonase
MQLQRAQTMTDLKKWRDAVAEEAIDPDIPIIDTHHHCWGTASPVPTFPDYGFEDILNDVAASGHHIIATVYVQAYSHFRQNGPDHLRPVGETEYMNAMAELGLKIGGKAKNLFAGIVAYADLFLGKAVGEVLDAHIAAAPARFKGIRYLTTYDADNTTHSRGNTARMLSMPEFREAIAELAPRGLVFESMVFHPQLLDVVELAQASPQTSIVLNHIGAPMIIGRFADRRDEVFKDWSESMKSLAKCPNVVVKIGGMNSHRTGLALMGGDRAPTSEELAHKQGDFVHRVIDLFGPNRCMFESNFPVDMLGTSYIVLWNSLKRMVAGYSDQEKRAMFSETARRIYDLNLE